MVAMAWSYVKMFMFGTAAAYSRDDEIMAAVAVLTQVQKKNARGEVRCQATRLTSVIELQQTGS